MFLDIYDFYEISKFYETPSCVYGRKKMIFLTNSFFFFHSFFHLVPFTHPYFIFFFYLILFIYFFFYHLFFVLSSLEPHYLPPLAGMIRKMETEWKVDGDTWAASSRKLKRVGVCSAFVPPPTRLSSCKCVNERVSINNSSSTGGSSKETVFLCCVH